MLYLLRYLNKTVVLTEKDTVRDKENQYQQEIRIEKDEVFTELYIAFWSGHHPPKRPDKVKR